jgi:hypothetical protein
MATMLVTRALLVTMGSSSPINGMELWYAAFFQADKRIIT